MLYLFADTKCLKIHSTWTTKENPAKSYQSQNTTSYILSCDISVFALFSYLETILSDYSSDYKSRLIKLHLLLLMYVLDVNVIIFFIESLRAHLLYQICNWCNDIFGAHKKSTFA